MNRSNGKCSEPVQSKKSLAHFPIWIRSVNSMTTSLTSRIWLIACQLSWTPHVTNLYQKSIFTILITFRDGRPTWLPSPMNSNFCQRPTFHEILHKLFREFTLSVFETITYSTFSCMSCCCNRQLIRAKVLYRLIYTVRIYSCILRWY